MLLQQCCAQLVTLVTRQISRDKSDLKLSVQSLHFRMAEPKSSKYCSFSRKLKVYAYFRLLLSYIVTSGQPCVANQVACCQVCFMLYYMLILPFFLCSERFVRGLSGIKIPSKSSTCSSFEVRFTIRGQRGELVCRHQSPRESRYIH